MQPTTYNVRVPEGHEHIKGSCEHCGFAYEGVIKLKDGVYPELTCRCGQTTYNFDDAETVTENDKTENYEYDYTFMAFAH